MEKKLIKIDLNWNLNKKKNICTLDPLKNSPRTVKVYNSPGHPVQLITQAVILLPTT